MVKKAHSPTIRFLLPDMMKREGGSVLFKGLRCAYARDIIGYFFYFGSYELCLKVSILSTGILSGLLALINS